jgi:hypothetical protein
MASYKPLKITGMTTGLVQERENFILPNDAYPVLENAFVWRERIKRKKGCQLLGRLRRAEVNLVQAQTNGLAQYTVADVLSSVRVSEPGAEIEPGSVTITIAPAVPIETTIYTDTGGTGALTYVSGPYTISSGSINYSSGALVLNFTVPPPAVRNVVVQVSYFPGLPVMGLRSRQLTNINNEQLIAFDQKYAYRFSSNAWQEFIAGTTWTGNDSDFFWSTNYWVNASNEKLFWVTNFSGTSGDPIRYTDGTTWTNFAPQINSAGDVLAQCLAMLPFRGRLIVFNTLEGVDLSTSVSFPQRIRWSAIGSPLTANSWNEDIRGQGNYLDIPTSESIVSVGFVRDNLVVYCESSTWQLRYTGRSIAPFQIEKVNSELGAESTFSAVQFDTSLVGIGDKGVVECDSFKSDRIDVKIPDLVFQFNNDANGTKRVHGIRDFAQRLAYWTYPYKPNQSQSSSANFFPDKRLVYNYENDSWAIFDDSFTTLGTYQPQSGRRWIDVPYAWEDQNYPWVNRPSLFPAIVGGNQQGFVEFLDSQVTNDVSLTIQNITGNTTTPTVITSTSHNLRTGQVIKISQIPTGTPFSNLNSQIFSIIRVDANSFQLWLYNPLSGQFNTPQLDAPATYVGAGRIAIRDNFRIVSKKFNFIDDGQNVQLGYIDILLDNTEEGAITLQVYNDYNDNTPTNTFPQNATSDTFFNSVVPTTVPLNRGSSKNWQRVFCPTRAAFITIEWTLSNDQMIGVEQESNVQIDAQILWMRPAGNQLPIGI